MTLTLPMREPSIHYPALYESPTRAVYRVPPNEYLVVDGTTGGWAILDVDGYTTIGDAEKLSHTIFQPGEHSSTSLQAKAVGTPAGDTAAWGCPSSHIFVIHLTSKCNLKCRYCYALRSVEDVSSNTLEAILTFILRISARPSIQFIGGEPLIRFDLLRIAHEFLESVRTPSFRILLQTNGTIFNEEILDFITTPEVRVGVSLDGDPLSNDSRPMVSGASSTSRVEAFISALRGMGITPNVNCVINRTNFRRLSDSLCYLVGLGVKSVKFSFVYNGFEESDFCQLFTELSALYRWYLDTGLWKDVLLVDLLRLLKNCLSPARDYMCSRSPCGAGITHLAFDSNGDVYSCDFALGIPEFRIGSVLHDDPLDLVRSSACRNESINIDTNQDCSTCVLRRICGNCQVSSYTWSAEVNRRKVECAYMKQIIPWAMSVVHTNPNVQEFLAESPE